MKINSSLIRQLHQTNPIDRQLFANKTTNSNPNRLFLLRSRRLLTPHFYYSFHFLGFQIQINKTKSNTNKTNKLSNKYINHPISRPTNTVPLGRIETCESSPAQLSTSRVAPASGRSIKPTSTPFNPRKSISS